MAILIRRPKPKDTVKKFEASAERKYQAGLVLIDNGENHTGVEQFGYSAEMLLKSAYFRVAKGHHRLARSTSEIKGTHLREAAREGQRLGVPYDPESYHSLLFWASLLVATRAEQLRPLTTDVGDELLARVRQMHQIWMIEHRYQPINLRCRTSYRRGPMSLGSVIIIRFYGGSYAVRTDHTSRQPPADTARRSSHRRMAAATDEYA